MIHPTAGIMALLFLAWCAIVVLCGLAFVIAEILDAFRPRESPTARVTRTRASARGVGPKGRRLPPL